MTLRVATEAFLEGFQIGRRREDSGDAAGLLADLVELDLARRPFAFEGAAMAWELRDDRDRGGRSAKLVDVSDFAWRPLLLLGVGCAWARLGRGIPSDPMVLDGYGFQLGLRSGVSGLERPTGSPDIERGRGRALWFVTGGDGPACASAIQRATGLTQELWQGVGTACAFAGDPRRHAARLPRLAGPNAPGLLSGVERAAKLWCSLGDVPPRTAAVRDAMSCGLTA